jgi:hypothetical protein
VSRNDFSTSQDSSTIHQRSQSELCALRRSGEEMKILRLQLSSSNSYLLEGNKDYLIDCESKGDLPRLRSWFSKHNEERGDIAWVILTHGHSDHAGTAAALQQEYGLKVALHSGDIELVRTGSRKGSVLSGTGLRAWIGVDRVTPNLGARRGRDGSMNRPPLDTQGGRPGGRPPRGASLPRNLEHSPRASDKTRNPVPFLPDPFCATVPPFLPLARPLRTLRSTTARSCSALSP